MVYGHAHSYCLAVWVPSVGFYIERALCGSTEWWGYAMCIQVWVLGRLCWHCCQIRARVPLTPQLIPLPPPPPHPHGELSQSADRPTPPSPFHTPHSCCQVRSPASPAVPLYWQNSLRVKRSSLFCRSPQPQCAPTALIVYCRFTEQNNSTGCSETIP